MDPLPSSVQAWLRKPVVQLTVLGTLSWLGYLHLATDYPLTGVIARQPVWDFARASNWSRETLFHFALPLVGPLMPYLLGWRIVRQHRTDRHLLWVILFFAVLFASTLLAMYPIAATDIFDYIFHARILVHYGQNPLAAPPKAFSGDPFYRYVVWYDQPSPYGPLWTLLTAPVSYLGGDNLMLNVVLMNSLVAFFYLGCVVLIALILRKIEPDQQLAGTLLFAWNPLILFEAPGNGHNGIVMIFFALLAVYFYSRRLWTWVLPALLASVLVKYVTLLLGAPFLIFCLRAQQGWRQRWLFLAKTSVISAIVVGASLLPFHGLPWGLVYEAQWFSLLAIPTLLLHSLKDILGIQVASHLAIVAGSLAFIIVYATTLFSLTRVQHLGRLMALNTWIILTYLGLASTGFQPWFVVWPIGLGIWLNHPRLLSVIMTFTASGLLSYAANFVWMWNWKHWGLLQVNAMFVTIIYAPPALVGLWSLVQANRGRIQDNFRKFRGCSEIPKALVTIPASSYGYAKVWESDREPLPGELNGGTTKPTGGQPHNENGCPESSIAAPSGGSKGYHLQR